MSGPQAVARAPEQASVDREHAASVVPTTSLDAFVRQHDTSLTSDEVESAFRAMASHIGRWLRVNPVPTMSDGPDHLGQSCTVERERARRAATASTRLRTPSLA